MLKLVRNIVIFAISLVFIIKDAYYQFSINNMEKSAKQIKANCHIPNDVSTLALMADMAYKNPEKRMKKICEYNLMEKYNDETIVVYENGNEICISSRGTNKKCLLDWTAVMNVVIGNIRTSDKFIETENRVKQIIKENPDYIPKFTGHSLGASVLNEISIDLKIPLTSFNRGNWINSSDNNYNTDYVIKGDFVSNSILGQRKSNIHLFYPKYKMASHTIQNFLKPEQINAIT